MNMLYRMGTLPLGLAAVLVGIFAPTSRAVTPPAEGEAVAVVAEPKFYVIGTLGKDDMQFLKEPDPKRMWEVDGFILEIVSPPEYAGQIISMHHDGVLASGDPFKLWQVGRRYEFRISKESIGKLSFGPCSLGGTRKLLPK